MPILGRNISARRCAYGRAIGRGAFVKPFVTPAWIKTTPNKTVPQRLIITTDIPDPARHAIAFLLDTTPPLNKYALEFILGTAPPVAALTMMPGPSPRSSPAEDLVLSACSPPSTPPPMLSPRQQSPLLPQSLLSLPPPLTCQPLPALSPTASSPQPRSSPPMQPQPTNPSPSPPPTVQNAVNDSLYGPDPRGRWKVFRVVNKATSGRYRGWYKVVWYGTGPGRKPVTYEPRKHLIREGLKKAVLRVDRWIRKGRVGTFAQFSRNELPHGRVLTASPSNTGLCAFEALNNACVLQSQPEAASMELASAFIAQYKSKNGRDLRTGVGWDVIEKYAVFLKENGSALWCKKLQYNYVRSSVSSIRVVKEIGLPEGYYIVGAFRSDELGHCFVLRVMAGTYVVYEDGQEQEVEEYGEWVAELRFVRRVSFFRK